MAAPEHERRPGLADAIGGAAIYPARVAARAWRGRLETAAEEVLSAPETARIVDRAFAGTLPEEVARSLVRHRVLERIVEELAASGELDRLLDEALVSERTRQALRRVAAAPELRQAAAAQSAGLLEELAARVRADAARLDSRLPGRTPFGGIASRGVALAVDAALTAAACAIAGAAAALVASLVGGVHPRALAGALLAVGSIVVTGGYFTLFWAAVGQTPGMRALRLRVRPVSPERRLTTGRAAVRTVGLALAIAPLCLGFAPALLDRRRRALPDYLAGTVVVHDDVDVGRRERHAGEADR